MTSLTTLIQTAPFDGETRKLIMDKLPTLSADQKREITELGWTMIAAEYENMLTTQTDLMLADMEEGKKIYQPSDFRELSDQLAVDVAKKLELSGTSDEIKQVKDQLAQYATESDQLSNQP
ncbi:MAG: hypothetical protein NUV98_06780 [Candidatus Roizmanbacteria bacterium]|nr:hypothetical protein [Candidatus Roizmanbacteria bacterium]